MILIISILPIFVLVSYLLRDRVLGEKMIEKYSDNQNYVEFTGEVLKCDGQYIEIKCAEMGNYVRAYEEHYYYVCSDQVIDFDIGTEINFVTVPYVFYSGHKLPIVEIKLNGVTLLEFEEGKENLIAWVNTNFN